MDPFKPKGSYAGAMGLGQFMPSSFHKWAVDFDRNGKRDLWNPVDAIGSVANYFAAHGWCKGEPVAVRAATSEAGAVAMKMGYDTGYSLAALSRGGGNQRTQGVRGWRQGQPDRAGRRQWIRLLARIEELLRDCTLQPQ